jgi:hypothetical protein
MGTLEHWNGHVVRNLIGDVGLTTKSSFLQTRYVCFDDFYIPTGLEHPGIFLDLFTRRSFHPSL